MRLVFLGAALIAAVPLFAQTQDQDTDAAETVSVEDGLAAWERIYAVASHPRCTNCHVGDQPEPMWEGLTYGADARHGMNVLAGESRIGAETIPCRTCHVTSESANTLPHAPAHIEEAWRLPPVELDWLDKSTVEVCNQLRDPERNDGNTIAELGDHVLESPFVAWGFNPGGGRDAPEGTTTDLARDIALWGAAGTPCEGD